MAGEQISATKADSPFWRFSLALYRQDGVAPACIALQDDAGVDVNVMLYALWLASKSRKLSVEDMAAIDAAVRQWRMEVVVPLRAVRRNLKEPPAAFDSPDTRALRERIKSVELESEKLQQQALFSLRPADDWGAPEPNIENAVRANLQAYALALGAQFDDGAQSAMLGGMKALAATGRMTGAS